MSKFSEEDKERYRTVAAMVAQRHKNCLPELHANVKLALRAVQEGLPEGADQETIISFMGSVCYLMARLMNASMHDAYYMVRGIFDNYSIAIASLLGVYDLDIAEDSPEMRDLEKAYEDFERAVKTDAKDDAWWQEQLKKAYL